MDKLVPHHFDPLRPNRTLGQPEKYEFAHGTDSVCAYDIRTMEFVKEIPVGVKPDCHSTSLDNRWLYMACGGGLYIIDQQSLEVAKVMDTGHVYATNTMPDGDTMLLHDWFGGVFVLKGIQDMDTIHIHKRVDVLHTTKPGDTLGGKGHFLGNGRYYLVCGWEHSSMHLMDLQDDYSVETFIDYAPELFRGDDLVITSDKRRAYCACHRDDAQSHITVVDLDSKQVIKTIASGRGTCGMTMTNDERYVIGSNDADDSITMIDTTTDEAMTLSAMPGSRELGITGYIQGISIGQNNEVYVYGCHGNGALVRFSDITGTPKYAVSYPGGYAEGLACSV